MKMGTISGYAVDVGGTKTAAAKILDGVVINRLVQDTDRNLDLDSQLDHIEQILTALGWRGKGEAIGLTVSGRVSASGHWSAVNSATLTKLDEAPLADRAKARFGNISVSNDASATTLAEYHLGAGTGANNFVYLTVSTGVGGGIIANKRLIVSARGLAGHAGFSTVRQGFATCGSGRVGTVESVASGTAIAAMATQAGHAGLTGKDVFEACYAGEAWAEKIVDCSAQSLAELCANLAATLDPDRIALGGSIGLAPGYIERVRYFLDQEPALFRVPIIHASLGADGPLLGALIHERCQ